MFTPLVFAPLVEVHCGRLGLGIAVHLRTLWKIDFLGYFGEKLTSERRKGSRPREIFGLGRQGESG
jgi:hypothetical protein